MKARARAGGLTAIAWALVGVLGGHVLTYRIVFPGAHQHAAALDASGHGWLGLLGPAVALALAVAVATGLLGWTEVHRRGPGGPGRPGRPARGVRFAVLAAIQLAAFIALEVGERLGAGLTLRTLPHELFAHGFAAVLGVGCLVQVVTAWLGSAVSRVIERVSAGLRRRSPRPRSAPAVPVPLRASPPAARSLRAHRSRGPPLLVVHPRSI